MKHWKKIGLGGLLALLLLAMTAWEQEVSWSGQAQAIRAVTGLTDPGSLCSADYLPGTSTSFFVLLTTGLLTGLSHCVGMCGPLVGAFTLRRRAQRGEVTTPLVLFQTGRLASYVLLGALLGASGHLLAATIRDWQGVISVLLGLGMALLGLSLWGLLPTQRWLASARLTRTVSGWMGHFLSSDHPLAPFGLGLTNGLLPCGPVYAMGLMVALSGDALRGASIMLIFGLGTLPAMLGIGLSAWLLSLRVRASLYRLAASLVILVGLQLALRGLALNGQVAHATLGSPMLW